MTRQPTATRGSGVKPPPGYAPIYDTREQTPLALPGAVRGTLQTADYTCCAAHRQVVGVERKNAYDLLACVGRERDRFERELARLRRFRYRALVIEGNLCDFLTGAHWRSLVHPSSLLGSLATWACRFEVFPLFASNPVHATELTERFLMKAHAEADAAPVRNVAVDYYRCPPLSTLKSRDDCDTAIHLAVEAMTGLDPETTPLEVFHGYMTKVHLRQEEIRVKEERRATKEGGIS